MQDKLHQTELDRQILQSQLDRLKTSEERNVLGQFSTPIALANDILAHAEELMPKHDKVRFLDPAIGTGAFYSAMKNIFQPKAIHMATGFEIDEHYGKPSGELWEGTGLNYQMGDFTTQIPPLEEDDKYNLIICNPPYVRHHHINNQKKRLQSSSFAAANMKLSGLAGLYCYFMALSHPWLKKNGLAGWLVPSEFMCVNYGEAVRKYLTSEVTLLHVHRFDPAEIQFDDALVSSVIVWFKNKKPNKEHRVKFTYGGCSMNVPTHEKYIDIEVLRKEKKWTRFPLSEEREICTSSKLSDFFLIKRGIATGDNNFFILTREKIENYGLPFEHFKPILPSPRYLKVAQVNADANGFPAIDEQLFVLDCKLSIDRIKSDHPQLYAYIEEGVCGGVPEKYLCKNRKIWYAQENRNESRFYCTYMGRSSKDGVSPLRFILNRSKAIVANSYLILYPKPEVEKAITENPNMDKQLHEILGLITGKAMQDEGRVYGGGMHKMEPKELANVPAAEIGFLLEKFSSAI